MIDPAPPQRGTIGEQHGLATLTKTLEALSAGQTAQHQRDTQIQEQLTALAQSTKRLVLVIEILAVLVGSACGLVGWQLTRPDPALGYVKALGAIDAAVGQQWLQMPKAVQEQLSATYSRVGLTPPGQRK